MPPGVVTLPPLITQPFVRMTIRLFSLALLCSAALAAQSPSEATGIPTFFGADPLAHTFSIVARDSATGDLGIAVQSHWFSVGAVVSWAEAGVGVVATQSFVNKSFGPRGLALMKNGLSPQAALDSLLADDPGREVRQVALLNTQGQVATHTGKNCIQYACHTKGFQYSVQANMMLGAEVCNAMERAFEASNGKPLAERLLLALEAAQGAGGDFRGQQSSALLVAPGESTGRPWDDQLINLRVDDHAEPIRELRRLYEVHQAYEHMNKGDYYVEMNDMAAAMREYDTARALLPEQVELQFWTALTLANIGKTDEALPLFVAVFQNQPIWREIMPRLAAVGLVTVAPADLERILRK